MLALSWQKDSLNVGIFNHAGVSMKSLELIKWRDSSGQVKRFSLIGEVSSEWKAFGNLLEIPPDKLAAWEREIGDSTECWRRVMHHWLAAGGTHDYPTTWEGVYELLEDINCAGVAKKLKEAVARY